MGSGGPGHASNWGTAAGRNRSVPRWGGRDGEGHPSIGAAAQADLDAADRFGQAQAPMGGSGQGHASNWGTAAGRNQSVPRWGGRGGEGHPSIGTAAQAGLDAGDRFGQAPGPDGGGSGQGTPRTWRRRAGSRLDGGGWWPGPGPDGGQRPGARLAKPGAAAAGGHTSKPEAAAGKDRAASLRRASTPARLARNAPNPPPAPSQSPTVWEVSTTFLRPIRLSDVLGAHYGHVSRETCPDGGP